MIDSDYYTIKKKKVYSYLNYSFIHLLCIVYNHSNMFPAITKISQARDFII
jgi:hypothetical protein